MNTASVSDSAREFSPGLSVRGIAPPLRLRDFKLIAFDMDSTLINIECVDEIAGVAGRKAEGAEITEADTVFYHMVGGYWGGETEVDWEVGYQQVPSGNAIELLGKKVGSRVLLIYPADESNTEAQVLVLDLLASVPA